MEESMEDRGKRLRMAKAVIEDDVDYDWAYFDDKVELLEESIANMEDSIERDALALVVVQCYLNRMRRDFDEVDGVISDD